MNQANGRDARAKSSKASISAVSSAASDSSGNLGNDNSDDPHQHGTPASLPWGNDEILSPPMIDRRQAKSHRIGSRNSEPRNIDFATPTSVECCLKVKLPARQKLGSLFYHFTVGAETRNDAKISNIPLFKFSKSPSHNRTLNRLILGEQRSTPLGSCLARL